MDDHRGGDDDERHEGDGELGRGELRSLGSVGKVVRMVLEQPWTRVKDPTPIPGAVDASALAQLDDDRFARLVRDHLVPRSQDPAIRAAWQHLWTLLARSRSLQDRALDVLDDLIDVTDRALDDGTLEEHPRKRAEKFLRLCEDASQRLQGDDRPLRWAGPAATGFNPPARRVIAHLVDAVADHRDAILACGPPRPIDERLWQVLARINLDPGTSQEPRNDPPALAAQSAATIDDTEGT